MQQPLLNNLISMVTEVIRRSDELTKETVPSMMTTQQYRIMQHIFLEGPVTPSDITTCMDLSLPNTSRELKKLQDKQLLYKVTDPDDKRRQVIHLTKEGQSLMEDVFQKIYAILTHTLKDVPASEIEKLDASISTLRRYLFSSESE